MMGRPGLLEEKGLIPRSLEQIFQTRQSLQPQGWKYEMQVREKEDGSFLFTIYSMYVFYCHILRHVY